ncbi:MAG: hypothetical protein GF401_06240 [Chitinivibrionales bacterium]|nr:hypothetical protein [Chitinivibrionales bacterium]
MKLFRNGSKYTNKQGLSAYLILFILLTLMSFSARAQQRCNLISDTTQCIDPVGIDGQTITVPSSVTRIPADGLVLCPRISMDTLAADVVFILDQSGSMQSLAVSVQGGDSVFCHADCNGELGTTTITYNGSPTEIDVCSGCPHGRISGDPYGQRANVIKTAIDRMAELNDSSAAGFIEHGQQLGPNNVLLRQLNDQSNIDLLKDNIDIKFLSETSYSIPLTEAKKWLNNPNVRYNEKSMIIMVSDGKPGEIDEQWLNVVFDQSFPPPYGGTMPPVYGIFLGDPDYNDYEDYRSLALLSDTTGGEFFIVPPENVDSLNRVMDEILINQLTQKSIDVTIRNETNGQESKSVRGRSTFKNNKMYLGLDSIVALEEGTNEIYLKIEYLDGTSDEANFTIDVSGSDPPSSSFLETECLDTSLLSILDIDENVVSSLDEKDDSFYVQLKTPPLLSKYKPSLVTQQKDDRENLTLDTASDAFGTDGQRIILQQKLALSFPTADPTNNNLKLESNTSDSLIATWSYPRDPRDVARVAIPISKVLFAPDSAFIYDSDVDGRGDSIVIFYNRPIPEAFPVDYAYWNQEGDDYKKENPTAEFIGSNDSIVAYTFTDQFDANLTGISSTGNEPYAHVSPSSSEYSLAPGKSTVDIQDRIKPVPVNATLRTSPAAGSYPDTLVLVVSEPLESTGDEPWKQLLKHNTEDNYGSSQTLSTVSRISVSSDGLTYRLAVPKDADLSAVDYLFLNNSGPYTDKPGNVPAEKSVRLKVNTYIYFALESDPSTPVDEVIWPNESSFVAVIVSEAQTDEITLNIEIPNEGGDKGEFTATRESGSQFTVTIPFKFVGSKEIDQSNQVAEAAIFDITGGNEATLEAAVSVEINSDRTDSASSELTLRYDPGPSVTRVLYFPGNEPLASTTNPDLMIVKFNEDVKWPQGTEDTPIDSVFTIRKPDGTTIDMSELTLTRPSSDDSSGYAYITVPFRLINTLKIDPGEDSLSLIKGTPFVIDNSDHLPPGNVVLIQWGVDLKPVPAVKSPFSPTAELPEGVTTFLENNPDSRVKQAKTGTFIQVISKKLLTDESYVTIYDAVGNIVIENLAIARYEKGDKDKYYTAWTGINRNGRIVGSGTYVAYIFLKDIDGDTETVKQLIAVTR